MLFRSVTPKHLEFQSSNSKSTLSLINVNIVIFKPLCRENFLETAGYEIVKKKLPAHKLITST